MEKYYSNKYIFWILLLLLMLMLPQWVVAQSSLPACTASIADTDGDSITDDDGTGGRIDIDKDGDGLIEICDLEGINEIRYQLDGSGYKPRPDATKMTHGCPHSGCIGYELVSSLDFNVDASYRSASSNKDAWTNPNAAGWQPIGSTVAPFSSVFEGNEHTISNLYINRTAMNIALFAVIHGDGELRNIGLSDVDIQGSAVVGSLVASNHGRIIHSDVSGTVNGDTTVGGLVGSNDGQIIFSIADVAVTGSSAQVGGLAGSNVSLIRESSASGNVVGIDYVGGLVGLNEGRIINSYASGEVRGSNRIGGLTGAIATGARIINTYAEGTVSGADQVGGLVGEHSGEMSNSYAVGQVTSNGSDIGGLVGTSATVAVITASYWDKTVNASLSESANARTTAELQMPTEAGVTAMAIYYRWSEIAWYFGGDTDYPRLRYTAAIDGDGDRVNDVADIDDDNDGLIEIYYLDDLHTMRFQPDGSGHRQSAIESKNTTGCPQGGCIGYELTRALDFNNANDYRNYLINTDWIVADYADTSMAGWQPIANFEAVFNGNGHIISNLQINRVSEQHVGLFAVLGADGRIENVELLYPNLRGHSDVGSLVGINRGVVINSFVRDYDTDANSRDTTQYIEALEGSVGGLVGRNDGGGNNKGAISNSGAVVTVQIKDSATAKEATAGGLVGLSAGDIRNSYARGEAKGPCMVGGLTAQLEENSKVVNSYASVTVTTGFGACTTAANIQSGSLVATNNGLIEDSYATGCWSAATSGTVNNRRGGLIFTNSSRINNSYYQNCNGLLEVSSGSAKTQVELQSPTTATAVSGIYQAWSNSDWDFGSNSQYPAIRYSVGVDKDNPGCGYRGLPDCGALIKNQLPTGRTVTDSVNSVANLNFVPGNILTAISRQEDIGAFALQPPRFDFADNTYKLYVQDERTDPTDTSDTMQFNLMLGSNYQFSNCTTNITTLSSGMGSLSCVNSGAEVLFNLPHTITFNITDTSTSPPTAYGLFSIEIIPDLLFSSVIVNSEVNGEPATFVGDGEVMRVHEGDTVSVDAMDSFVLREDVNRPLDYYWYSRSNPALFPGVRRGAATSFTIDNTIFSDSRSDAVLVLEVRDKYNSAATPIIKEIPIRLFGRLSLSSDVGEVMRDRVTSTLHRIVLPHDQPQAIITARSLHNNITLTVDDSDTQVTAMNGSGTSTASMITVQVDEGGKTEFTIAETVAGDAIVLHRVQVFRRSTVALAAIQLANVTVDASISVPGTYSAILAEGMSNVTLTEFSLTVTDTNASAVTTMTVDADGSGGNLAQSVIEPTIYYDPGVVANIATESFDLMVGSVIEITLRMRDEYVVATRASSTLEDLPYTQGVYTIEIVSRPDTILDDDINSLIDIDTLEDLDDIRNHYANMPRSCGIEAIQQCRGFELRRSLDFNVDASYSSLANKMSWTMGDGWQPIGLGASGFNSRFEGNGHTISGLFMNRSANDLGLFSILDATGEIKNVGLLDVDIQGDSHIGGLVGRNHGVIINSYVSTATVVGNMDVGGLVGRNDGSIISSFVDVEVSGNGRIGGLVGNHQGRIANAYAAGTVSGSHATLDLPLGGLVGRNDGAITNSYAISLVQPQIANAVQAGGLIGMMSSTATITASYWNRTVNVNLMRSANARTTAELQNPTMAGTTPTATYYRWHSNDWDFGDNVDYSTLRYATVTSINACNTTTTSVVPQCGSLLPNQNIRLLSSAFGVSHIMISSRPAANSDSTINEGSVVSLMVDVFDDKEYSYQWSQTSGNPLTLVNTTSAAVQVTIPTDFIATDATVADITLEVMVNDGVATIRQSEMITISKINNGNPDLATDVSPARLRVIAEPDGDGAGVFSYQWQQLEFGREWANITDATTATYWLPADSNSTIRYRVNIQHTDGQGYTTNYQQGPFRVGNIDDDGNGLIDIYYLEDLDAMRYQLDGSSYKMSRQATANTHGCPEQICSGYELRRDLDFNAAADYSSTANQVAWTTGAGWQPIGHSFNSVFEGNGHIIANLQISRAADDLGLYAVVGADGKIINVKLLDVDVEGRDGGGVGALVGSNYGAIINSYVTGKVRGFNVTAGLSGYNLSSGEIINSYATIGVEGRSVTGGLVGVSYGTITNSYAAGDVEGEIGTGGLTGWNIGTITNSYATGTVTGVSSSGGLVGVLNFGTITNSYATGTVTGGSNTGGLIGENSSRPVTASYWNTSTTNVMTSAGGIPKTTVELQSPTDATGIYSDWSRNDWEFGGSEDYPVLRYARDDNLVSCASDVADIVISLALPICGSVLPEQGVRASNKGLAEVFFFVGGHAAPIELTPSFFQPIYSYDMTVVTADRNIQLRPYAANANAEIAITQGSTDYFSNRASGALSDAIDLKANETTVTIVVTDIVGEDPITTTYTFVIVRLLPIRVDTSRSRLTLIFEEATADPDGVGSFSYQWQQQKPGTGWINIAGATTPTYWLPADADGSLRYRLVNIKHIDGGGNITNYPTEGPFRISADDDGDGLIDIYTLDDLDAIRYQLDGRGYRRNKDAKLIVQDCPGQVCSGYELIRDLDFNADTHYHTTSNKIIWTMGSGWVPIGDNNNRFSSVFEGNGYTISGLYIDDEGLSDVGLFSVLDTNSEIKNVGLLNIDIISSSFNVGAVAAENYGSIINSYASGDIEGNYEIAGLVSKNRSEGKIMSSFANVNVVADSGSAGGLVGPNDGLIINSYATGTVRSRHTSGGLVGANQGSIISSYATGDVIAGGNFIGGLVGSNHGSIKNTYARGAVSGASRVGGLVGSNGFSIGTGSRSIAYSYATGTVAGSGNVGGLIGWNNGDITTSYWDTDTSDINRSAGGSDKTTVELQSPNEAGTIETDVYYGWSESDWDFGDSNRYPALRYVSGDVDACNSTETVSLLPACGTLLSQQRRGLDRMLLMANDEDVTELLTPSFSHSIFRYETTLTTIATPISFTLKPLATHANATIKITQQGDTTTDYFAGKANDTLSDPIISSHSITLEVVVTDTLYGDITTDTIYTVEIAIPFTVAEFTTSLDAIHADGTIDEGSTATITFAVSGGSGNYRYQYKLIDRASERELSQLPPPVGLSMPADLVAAENTTQTVELNILVSDDEGRSFEQSAEITVRKVDNGLAMVDVIRATSRTLTVKVGSDPDGDASEPGYEYQWQWREPEAGSSWQSIMFATTASYMISDDLAVIGNEFRVQVIYTDGQGYRPDGGVYSDVVQYILLPMCVNEITDSDGDEVVGSIDIDKDGDGLIELCDLEGINEMRYQFDGSGYKVSESATVIRQGCPIVAGEAQCRGYELARDLDFNDATSYRNNTTSSEWTAGAGWLPIAANFGSVFEGNGYSISGLYINRTEPASGSEQGLFSTLAATAQINNIRLLDVNVQGVSVVAALASRNAGIISDSSVTGAVVANADVGGLVGINDGQIISSFADVAVTATLNGGGGLMGRNQGSVSASYATGRVMGDASLGGLSGLNSGSIISSYATGSVTGSDHIGGLVGSHHGAITNSYATGDVEGMNNIGGLVGLNNGLGRITNSYAIGTVMGASQVGGLVGRHHGLVMNSYATIGAVIGNESSSNIGGLIGMMSSTATIIASYWNSETSKQESSAGGRAQMTAELQNPIAPGTTTTEVYYRWSSNDWDFGNSSHYPALRYAADDDLNDCVTDITTSSLVLPCTLLLPNQRGRNKGLATVFFFTDGDVAQEMLAPLFTPLTESYDMTVLIASTHTQLSLRPYAINDNATIAISAAEASRDYFAGKSSGELSEEILLGDEIILTVVVTDTVDGDSVNTTYTFTIARTRPPLVISGLMITPSATIDEGSDVTIGYTVSGGSGVYEYAHKIDEGEFTQSFPSFIYRAPVDLIATDATTQAVRITIKVSDQDTIVETISHHEEIMVRKIDNGGSFSIRSEVDASQLHIIIEGSDPDGDGSFSYQWQQRGLDGIWEDIEGATTATYNVPAESNGSVRYRIAKIKHTDGQGYDTDYAAQRPFKVGIIDDDNDGLIDIYYLDDLNAIRYQLDGKGYKMSLSATTNTADCPLTGCIGYELRRDLDFTADASYGAIANKAIWAADSAIKANATNSGWLPIGDTNNRFSSVFEGNGFVISNLYTKAGNDKGLFSVLDNSGEIKRVGLLDAYVEGDTQIGTLVGQNYGKITNSYATISTAIASGSESSPVGGLVGFNQTGGQIISSFANVVVMASSHIAGGLVGRNNGLIINSYATGDVSGMNEIGGLVGRQDSGSVMNSYATGDINGQLDIGGLIGYASGDITNTYAGGAVTGERVGGLTGWNISNITNSYALGRVSGSRIAGGLFGLGRGSITASYWDRTVNSNLTMTANAKTTAELQTPTAPGLMATDVYHGWSSNDWDFGDNHHYPALRHARGPANLNACNTDITLPSAVLPSAVLPCAVPLPNQRGRDRGLATVFVLADGVDLTEGLRPLFSPLRFSYDMAIVSTATTVEFSLRPYAINDNATITITDPTDENYFSEKLNGGLSATIVLSDAITLTVVVTDTIDEATINTTYTFVINRVLPLVVSGIMVSSDTIDEGATAMLSFEVSGGTDVYRYAYKLIAGEDEALLAQSAPPVELTIPTDIVAAEDAQQAVTLQIIVSDDGGQTVETSKTLTIQKVDNGVADIVINRATSRTMIAMMGADPDGATDDSAYQWQWRGLGAYAQWMDLESATSTAYTITDEFAVDGNEFRVQAAYTDGQGYRYDALYSKTMKYDLLPRCTLAIADRDNDGVESSIDVDKDGDGLIELCDLESIDEMRYQADGRGYRPNENAINIMRGCPLVDGEERCRGYELVRSLDFNAADSYRNNTTSSKWTAASGWLPLVANYSTVFEGNGHSISGLYIARTDVASGSEQGLFSTLAATAQIKNIRLLNVTIQGLSVVGAVASRNSGIIINSSVSGAVEATADVGGLVGINDGHIISSFADVAVSATTNSGGLVGRNQGAITNSYARGNVTASGDNIGGLVGLNNELGRITNTYAEGTVMGASQVGGLVGSHHGMIMNSYATIGVASGGGSHLGGLIGMASSIATVIASYWDTERSEVEDSAGGSGQTTAELQTPIIPGTTTTEVYYRWHTSDWDFGDSHHYPALRYASGADPDICITEITTSSLVLPCTLLLPGQRGRDRGLAAVFFFVGSEVAPVALTPPFTPLTGNYDMTIIIPQNIDPKIQLRPYAINDNAMIRVTEPGSATDYYAGKSNNELSDEIALGDETIVSIVVTDSSDGDADHTTYTFTIESAREPLAISEFMIEPSATIDEGSHTTITYTVSGGSGVYEYAYKIDDGALIQSSSSFVYRAPVNLVASDATTQAVSITIRVSDQDEAVEVLEHSEVITVRKIDNGGRFNITSEVDSSQLRIVTEGDDPDGDGRFSYQWQQLVVEGEWTDIIDATMATYDVPTDLNESIRYRANIQHTDGQGYITDYQVGPLRASIDDDDDGLIDIYYLEDLNAMRYQLDGSGYQMNSSAPINTQGCPTTGCIGYELRRDLDFADAASYSAIANQATWLPNTENTAAATNQGWSPIGDNSNRFSGVFDGNGFTIANLYTRGGNNKGLFSALHSDGEIRHVGLLDAYIQGGSNVGTLVAHNYGKITDSYAMRGIVTANDPGESPVGGLVGFNQSGSQIISSFADVAVMASNNAVGGLVGRNQGLVMNSQAGGNVEGMNDVGGLVGRHDDGSVVNSYASGDISGQRGIGGLAGYVSASITNTYAHGNVTGRSNAGGLVGENRGSITNSYATGQNFSSVNNIGGLVGVGNSNNVTQSYWDTETTRIPAISAGGMAQTTVALQTPTAPGTTPTDVYYGWSEDDWDFGDNSHYPLLRHARGPDDVNACNTDITASSAMLSCQVPLPNQSDRNQGLAALFLLADGNDVTAEYIPTFFPLESNYNTIIVSTATDIQLILRPYTINANATIAITDQDNRNYFAGKSNGALSDVMKVSDSLTVTVVVTDTIADSTIDTTYTLLIRKVEAFEVSEFTISSQPAANADGTINEGSNVRITYTVRGGTGVYQYSYKLIVGADETLLSQSPPPVDLVMPANTVSANDTERAVELNIRVGDDGGHTFEHRAELTVRKVNNGEAEIAISRETTRTLMVKVGSDPDGDPNPAGYTYQWQTRALEPSSRWMNINSATNDTYTITDDLANAGGEFRIQVMYTDGQGYKETLISNVIQHTSPSQGIKVRTKVFLEGPLR